MYIVQVIGLGSRVFVRVSSGNQCHVCLPEPCMSMEKSRRAFTWICALAQKKRADGVMAFHHRHHQHHHRHHHYHDIDYSYYLYHCHHHRMICNVWKLCIMCVCMFVLRFAFLVLVMVLRFPQCSTPLPILLMLRRPGFDVQVSWFPTASPMSPPYSRPPTRSPHLPT